jgi:hypothetical protein
MSDDPKKSVRQAVADSASSATRFVARAGLYSLVGDRKAFMEERRRNLGLIRGFIEKLRPRRGLKETFAEAMARQGLTYTHLAEIEASLVRQSRIYSVALTVVLLVFCGLPWVSEPLSHIAMCFSLGAYCGAILFRVRFRLAQVRSRELFSLWTWLRRFWGASS